MATFAYLRVSTHEQSADNQRLEIERAGYRIDYVFADEGVSGSTAAAQRPQFSALLDRIRDGEHLVVTKLDRLGRDAQDIGTTIKLLTARRIEVTVLQLGKLDLSSAAGKMMLAMLAAVAEMERDLLIERTHAGLERAKAEGKILGRPARLTARERQDALDLQRGGMSISALSRRFGVSRQTISRALDVTNTSASAKTGTADKTDAQQAL